MISPVWRRWGTECNVGKLRKAGKIKVQNGPGMGSHVAEETSRVKAKAPAPLRELVSLHFVFGE